MLSPIQNKAKTIIVFLMYVLFLALGPRAQDTSKLIAIALAIYSVEYIRTREKWYEMSVVTTVVTAFLFTMIPLIIMVLTLNEAAFYNSEKGDPFVYILLEVSLMWIIDKTYQKGAGVVKKELDKD